MRMFQLTILLATENMTTETHIADALEEVAGSIRDFVQNERPIYGSQEITDLEGKHVGEWGISLH